MGLQYGEREPTGGTVLIDSLDQATQELPDFDQVIAESGFTPDQEFVAEIAAIDEAFSGVGEEVEKEINRIVNVKRGYAESGVGSIVSLQQRY